jgi:hypothetical protein
MKVQEITNATDKKITRVFMKHSPTLRVIDSLPKLLRIVLHRRFPRAVPFGANLRYKILTDHFKANPPNGIAYDNGGLAYSGIGRSKEALLRKGDGVLTGRPEPGTSKKLTDMTAATISNCCVITLECNPGLDDFDERQWSNF